jgi:hypothetical protein
MCFLMSDNEKKKREIDVCKPAGFDLCDLTLYELFLECNYRI